MCTHIDLGNGQVAIVCGGRRRKRYCACGHEAPFLCDWRFTRRFTGTCDAAICEKCALQVGTNKHLCPRHQVAYEAWKRAHPQAEQMSLLDQSKESA